MRIENTVVNKFSGIRYDLSITDTGTMRICMVINDNKAAEEFIYNARWVTLDGYINAVNQYRDDVIAQD